MFVRACDQPYSLGVSVATVCSRTLVFVLACFYVVARWLLSWVGPHGHRGMFTLAGEPSQNGGEAQSFSLPDRTARDSGARAWRGAVGLGRGGLFCTAPANHGCDVRLEVPHPRPRT